MCDNYRYKLKKALRLFDGAEAVIVFSGAGMAYGAGLHTYKNLLKGEFSYYAEKYMLTDVNEGFFMVSGRDRQSFFLLYSRIFHDDAPYSATHAALLELLRSKPFFIVQTNSDYIYEKSGADKDCILHIAGYPHLLQCAHACNHGVLPMPGQAEDFPVCPLCGGETRPALDAYGDDNFICPPIYREELSNYSNFAVKFRNKRLLIFDLECGRHDHFGFNANVIIHAFAKRDNVRIICINRYEEACAGEDKCVCFHEPAGMVLGDMLKYRPPAKRGRPSALSKLQKKFPDIRL